MKKILTLFVAMLMLLSFPVAFADEENGTVGDNFNEYVEDNSTDDNGTIEIEVEIEDNSTVEENGTVEDNNTEEEEEEIELEAIEGVEEEAGVTPDSPLWGLDRALERIELSLTLGKSAKAKKGLAHAQERLLEVRQMIAEKKLDEATEAQEHHDETMQEVEEEIEELGDGDAEGELEEVLEIEEELQKHAAIVERIGELKLKTKGLTEEQKAAVDEITSSIDESSGKMQIEIMQKKDRVKIKLKAARNMSDEDIKALEAQVKEAVGNDTKADVKIIGKGANNEKNEKIANGKAKVKTVEEDEEDEEVEEEPVVEESAESDENSTVEDNSTTDDNSTA